MISEFRVNKRRVRIFPGDDCQAASTEIKQHPPRYISGRERAVEGKVSNCSCIVEVILNISSESCSPAVLTLRLMSLFVFNSCVPRPAHTNLPQLLCGKSNNPESLSRVLVDGKFPDFIHSDKGPCNKCVDQ